MEPDEPFPSREEQDAKSLRERLAVLSAVLSASDAERALDLTEVSAEPDLAGASVEAIVAELEACGLCSPPLQADDPPHVGRAGRQYLERGGEVPGESLWFLAQYVDDLDAREALADACSSAVDEFSWALVRGKGVEQALCVVPPAFAAAVDEELALRLFAATVALTTRLAAGAPAGCVAEEVVAAGIVSAATNTLRGRFEEGELSDAQLEHAVNELEGVYELFQDDDVLDLFLMEEPADAAVAGHSELHAKLAVVDQRLEAWFRPFAWGSPIGYLDDRPDG